MSVFVSIVLRTTGRIVTLPLLLFDQVFTVQAEKMACPIPFFFWNSYSDEFRQNIVSCLCPNLSWDAAWKELKKRMQN